MDKKVKNIIFIILIILVIAGLGVGGFFLFKSLRHRTTPIPTPTPSPTSTPSPTPPSPTSTPSPTPPSPTSTPSPTPPSPTPPAPPKTCGDLPKDFNVCNVRVGDPIQILGCVNGEYVKYGPTGCLELNAFTKQNYGKSFTEYCTNSINCSGTPTCQKGNGDVLFECSCGDLPSDQQIKDFCTGNCYVCQNGKYNWQVCSDCNTLRSQFLHYYPDKTFETTCTCDDGSPKQCTDEGGSVNLSCNVCSTDKNEINLACQGCGANQNEICMCDVSTSNKWKCVTQQIISGGCPKTKPNINCSVDPVCVSCVVNNQQNGGYIYYCPGDALPMSCIQGNWNLVGPNTVDGTPGIYIDGRSNLPVFQTKDNDLCLAGYNNSTNIPADSSYLYPTGGEFPPQWSILNTPQGFLYQGESGKQRGNFQPINNDTYLINNPCRPDSSFSNACWWTGTGASPLKLDCQNGGNLIQYCLKGNNSTKSLGDTNCGIPSGQTFECGPGAYTYTDESGNQNEYYKLGTGYCKCAEYMSAVTNTTKKYLGNECQYSDNITCSKNGVVDENGNCSCNKPYFGNSCEIKCPIGSYGLNCTISPLNSYPGRWFWLNPSLGRLTIQQGIINNGDNTYSILGQPDCGGPALSIKDCSPISAKLILNQTSGIITIIYSNNQYQSTSPQLDSSYKLYFSDGSQIYPDTF